MLTLILDSCTERGMVAFVNEEDILYVAGLPFGLHNSTFLVPKIDEGLTLLKKEPKDIELIAVTSGPGSYTGIRVGVAAAKSLSYACKIPLVSLYSLQGFIPDREGSFAAVLDAKMAGFYTMKGKKEGKKIIYETAPEVHGLEAAKEAIRGVNMIISPNCEPIRQKLGELPVDWIETAPDPMHLYQLSLDKFRSGNYSTDGSVEILYMR